jgi:hypothetical protein
VERWQSRQPWRCCSGTPTSGFSMDGDRSLFVAQSLIEIARREGLPKRYVTRLARLAFVSPMVAEAVAAGRAPAGINLQMLMDGRLALAPDWKDQQLLLQR